VCSREAAFVIMRVGPARGLGGGTVQDYARGRMWLQGFIEVVRRVVCGKVE